MTVKEVIIHLLSNYPLDKEVVVAGHDFSFDLSTDSFELAKVEVNSKGQLRKNSSFCEKVLIG